jgi:hypothetical protein
MRNLRPPAIFVFLYLSCTNNTDVKSKYHYDEPSLKSFVLSTRTVSDTSGVKQLDSILSNTFDDSTDFRKTISYLEIPFSDPNSSFRNQRLYERLLQAKLNSRYYQTAEKEVVQGKLKLLQQNNIGSPANDFTYITPAGYKNMYDIKRTSLCSTSTTRIAPRAKK